MRIESQRYDLTISQSEIYLENLYTDTPFQTELFEKPTLIEHSDRVVTKQMDQFMSEDDLLAMQDELASLSEEELLAMLEAEGADDE